MTGRWVAVGMVMFCLGRGVAGALGDTNLPPHRAAGKQLYQEGRREEALAAYMQSMDAQEENAGNATFFDSAYRWGAKTAAEDLKQYQTAEAILRKALTVWPDDPVVQGELGNLYLSRMRWFGDAQRAYEAAVQVAEARHDALLSARYCERLMSAYHDNPETRGQLVKQIESARQRALKHLENVADGPERERLARRLQDPYWSTKLVGKDLETRAAHLEVVRARYERAKQRSPQEAAIHAQMLGQCYVRMQQFESAIPHFEEYMRYVGTNATVLALLATAYDRLDRSEEALELMHASLRLVEVKRQAARTDFAKLAAPDHRVHWTVQEAIGIALKLNRPEEAFVFMESGRARAMLDLLAGKDTAPQEAYLSQTEREQAVLAAKIDAIQAQLEAERGRGGAEEIAALQRALELVQDRSRQLHVEEQNYRREVQSLQSAQPLTLQDARTMISNATLVAYWYPNYVAVLGPEGLRVSAIEAPSREEIAALRADIAAASPQARGLDVEGERPVTTLQSPELDARVRQFYDRLLRPIEAYLTTTQVIIVPDGDLHAVPFQMLHDGQGYLVERHAISYAPSAGVLRLCVAKHRSIGGRLLAFGNPNLGDPRFRLAHAEDEANKIGAHFPIARLLLGGDATEKAVQLLGGNYDILHFACHGELDPDDPMRSALRLTPDKDNDGYLHAGEIFDLHLNAGLVTLSACDSALGRITDGSEVMGLTRAFMFAGTPSVVASLWKVDDAATANLMVAFYEGLKEKPKTEALRSAQMAMIAKGLAPFYWAAFCLYGDPQ